MAMRREGAPAGRRAGALAIALLLMPMQLAAQEGGGVQEQHDSVSIHFVEADLRAVVQSLGRYLPKPVMVSGLPGTRVTLQTPAPVAQSQVAGLLRGLLESQSLLYAEDSAYIRIGPRPAEPAQAPLPPASDTGLRLFVIRLRHARATDVAGTINLLFGGGGEFSGERGLSTGTLSDELHRQNVPPAGAPIPAAPATGPPGSAALAGRVTIVPDELTNALLIRATPHDHEVLAAAVEELDLRPLQVLIEVLIVEARRTRDFSIGTSLFLPPQHLKGGGNGTIGGETKGAGLGDLVLRLLNVGRADLDATLSASESRGDVRIISRPVLLASNNTEASFLVGSQRPFVQVSRLLPTDNNNQDRVVQYRDVGTKLRVRPTINQDGYVSLAIQQEINAATNEVAFDAPVISTREATTQVFVRDGQTIMLGGLKDQQRDRSRSGVPLLSGLPIIGALFGSTSRNDSDTELYLFITPRILRNDADADSVTTPHLPEVGAR
ncbi:MAG: secretin N-terminal domain-containing protein [Gemmatimonadota bacterium]